MKNEFYVYEWFNIDTGEVFYVGKGKKGRYKETSQRNDYFKNYYNKYNCDVRKVRHKLEEDQAFNLEKELIEKYRNIGQCKCNLTDGGEGCTFQEGSWNDLFRKLQYLHDVKCAMDDMYNEEEYDSKNLQTKSLDELEELYKKYCDHVETKSAYKSYCHLTDYKPDRLSGYELRIQNEEIVMLTQLLAENVAKQHKKFKDFLNYKTEMDFICHNIDTDKFLKLIFDDVSYYNELAKVTMNVLWFMKNIGSSPDLSVFIKIKSYVIKDRYIHIKFNTSNDKTKIRVKIDLYDIMWGFLMFKDKALFQLIFEEIFVAPIIN